MANIKAKPFLSRLGKHGKEFVERVSSENRELSRFKLVEKQWTEAITDADQSQPSFLKLLQSLAELFPKLSGEQVLLMLRLLRFADNLDAIAVARRAVLNDPAELVLGLRMAYRTLFAVRGRWQNHCDIDQLLPMCACGDIELARRVAKGRRGAVSAFLNPTELMNVATVAWLNEDKETQAIIVAEIESTSMKCVNPWEQAELKAICAAYHRDSAAVASRIGDLLSSIKKLRDKTDISQVINLRAHGLYRLFEAKSPQLVKAFDASQGFPWDPEVHAWCSDHPAFSKEWDFKAISKDLHQIVVQGKVPGWLPKPQDLYQVELLEIDPSNELQMQVLEGTLGYSEHDPMRIAQACPVVVRHELTQEISEKDVWRFNTVGAKAKTTKSKRGPYRPID